MIDDFKIFTSTKCNNPYWVTKKVNWNDFVNQFKNPACHGQPFKNYLKNKTRLKDGPCFVPGEFKNHERIAKNQINRCLIALDIENITSEFIWRKIKQIKYKYLLHTTASHRKEKPRIRLFFPVDELIKPEDYNNITKNLVKKLDLEYATITDHKKNVKDIIDINNNKNGYEELKIRYNKIKNEAQKKKVKNFDTLQEIVDRISYKPNQFMYYPKIATDQEYLTGIRNKEIINIKDFNYPLASTSKNNSFKNYTGIKSISKSVNQVWPPTLISGLIGDFCREYNIIDVLRTFLYGIYIPERGKLRYYLSEDKPGAIIYSDCNGLENQFLYSNHGIHDPCGDGRLHNSFNLVKMHKFYGDLNQMSKFASDVLLKRI